MKSVRIRRLALSLALVILLLSTSSFTTAAPGDYVDVLIGFNSAIDSRMVTDLGGQVRHSYQYMPVVAARIPAAAAAALARNPAISFIEEDGIITASQIVPWGVERIGARDVHLEYGITGRAVKVAVLDTGIADSHRDLMVYGGADFTGTGHWADDHGHGTHVAGTVAALDNTVDVVGVAPDAQLYSVKVLNSQGSGMYSWLIAGIEWCIANNMRVINMSLSGTTHSAALEQACQNAWDAGVLLVAAAGNAGNAGGTGDNVRFPARYPSVIAVGATTINDVRASFSSTGPHLELVAPGHNILSTTWPSGIGVMSGTSMAAPHVAGTAALILEARPHWTNAQVRDRMNATAEPIGNGNPWQYGNGLVNAMAALTDYTLEVTVVTQATSYPPSSLIPIGVRVTTGMGIPRAAAVELNIFAPNAEIRYAGSSGNDGLVTFLYQHTREHGTGLFRVRADAYRRGYVPGSGTTSFMVE